MSGGRMSGHPRKHPMTGLSRFYTETSLLEYKVK